VTSTSSQDINLITSHSPPSLSYQLPEEKFSDFFEKKNPRHLLPLLLHSVGLSAGAGPLPTATAAAGTTRGLGTLFL
jgi:hypothetical protein